MATLKQSGVVHAKRLSPTHVRELEVYYDAGGTNLWNGGRRPRGVYFASTLVEEPEGGSYRAIAFGCGAQEKGTGYLLVVPLERYRPEPLRDVHARVERHAETIHALCEAGTDEALAHLRVILAGGRVTTLADAAEADTGPAAREGSS